MEEKERSEMLREGKTLSSSFLVKRIEYKQRRRGVSFIRVLDNNQLDYVFIEAPQNLEN